MKDNAQDSIAEAAKSLAQVASQLARIAEAMQPQFREFEDSMIGGPVTLSKQCVRAFGPAGEPLGSETWVTFAGIADDDQDILRLETPYAEFKAWVMGGEPTS